MPTSDLQLNPFNDMWETDEQKKERLEREQKMKETLASLGTALEDYQRARQVKEENQ